MVMLFCGNEAKSKANKKRRKTSQEKQREALEALKCIHENPL
jgi:hypothetical protein